MPTKATTFYKATVQYCLDEGRRKGEGFGNNRPLFFTVHGDFPDDVSLLRFRISISIDFVGLENAVMSLAFQETF